MKTIRFAVLFYFITGMKLLADGCFVVPFVWNKAKDINEPTQKAIIVYDAGREDLILQVKYEGPVEEFGWLIPVPSKPMVQKGSMDCFYELSKFTQELWEPRGRNGLASLGMSTKGIAEPEPVKVIEVKTVGAYDVAVLSAQDATGLQAWLGTNGFAFPSNKTDVLDAYVKRGWYFIAARINVAKADGFQVSAQGATFSRAASVEKKLASGELHPLQISFATDKCVFPLKISSVNGRASEVQLYVLSREPLVEQTMLEKRLPGIYAASLSRITNELEHRKVIREKDKQRFSALGLSAPGFLTDEDEIFELRKPRATEEELIPFVNVVDTNLPVLMKKLPRMAGNAWWLTKQTWAFQPEEMADLEFVPAVPVFAEKLGTKYGYFAAANLAPINSAAIPALLDAFESTNGTARLEALDAVCNLTYRPLVDERVGVAVVKLLQDSEREVRIEAAQYLSSPKMWKTDYVKMLMTLLHDPDQQVRRVAMRELGSHTEIEDEVPAFRTMLKDPDMNVRESGMMMLYRLRQPVAREDLLPFFSATDTMTLGSVFGLLHGRGPVRKFNVSNEEAIPLLKNENAFGRTAGLSILYENAQAQSVELALPLLNDRNPAIHERAGRVLRALTGQHFTADQTNEWQAWWTANKTNFVVELHPEEMRPVRRTPLARPGSEE